MITEKRITVCFSFVQLIYSAIYSGMDAGEGTICGGIGNAEHSVRGSPIKSPKFQGFQGSWTSKNTQKIFKKTLAFHMQYIYNSKAC